MAATPAWQPPTWLLVLSGLALGILAEFCAETPPAVLAWAVAQFSAQQLRLDQGEGGLWSGSGELQWLRQGQAPFPLGRWQWSAGRSGVLPAWTLSALSGPLQGGFTVSPGLSGASLAAIALDGRAESLPSGLGGIDLIHPGGALSLRADRITIENQGLSGQGTLAWRQGSSPLVAVAPLGSWRAEWELHQGRGEYVLITEAGPLHVEGRGQLQADGHRSLQGRAWSDPAAAATLRPILQMFGPPGPDGSVVIAQP